MLSKCHVSGLLFGVPSNKGQHSMASRCHYFPCSQYILLQLCYWLGFYKVQGFGALRNAFYSRNGTNYTSLCPTFPYLLLCSYNFLCYGLGFDRVQGLGLYEMGLFHNYYHLNVTTPHVPHQSFYVCAIFFVMGQGLIEFWGFMKYIISRIYIGIGCHCSPHSHIYFYALRFFFVMEQVIGCKVQGLRFYEMSMFNLFYGQ